MIPVDKYPALVAAEDALIRELARQDLNDEIGQSVTGTSYFEALDGDISGRPNWAQAVMKAIEAWEEANNE